MLKVNLWATLATKMSLELSIWCMCHQPLKHLHPFSASGQTGSSWFSSGTSYTGSTSCIWSIKQPTTESIASLWDGMLKSWGFSISFSCFNFSLMLSFTSESVSTPWISMAVQCQGLGQDECSNNETHQLDLLGQCLTTHHRSWACWWWPCSAWWTRHCWSASAWTTGEPSSPWGTPAR